MRLLIILNLLWILFPFQAGAVTYFTHEQALALAFQNPANAKKHELGLEGAKKKKVEEKLDEKLNQTKILAYTGKLKSSGDAGVVMFDAVIGKHEFIDYMAVLNAKGEIQFIEILAYRESYGGQVRGKGWRKQFEGKSEKEMPEHKDNISNISGATLSCQHVTDGVRKLLVIAKVFSEELSDK
jgi:hypothetical protein